MPHALAHRLAHTHTHTHMVCRDLGDCGSVFLDAGKDASLPCDRSMCSVVEEQMAMCYSPCMTAQCDWSKTSCQDEKALLGTCPFFDAIVLESLEAGATDVSFVEGGSVEGYGRCSRYSCDAAAVSTVPHGEDAVVTWYTAQQACESKGSTLIMTDLRNRINGGHTWVGAKARSDGSQHFMWGDGRELLRNGTGWIRVGAFQEPDGADPYLFPDYVGELCVGYFSGVGLWDDACELDMWKNGMHNSIFCEDGQIIDPEAEHVGVLPGKKCVVINDGGELVAGVDSGGTPASAAWGHCSSKKRLPSSGFQHNETDLHRLLHLDLPTLLTRHPGCGTNPLMVKANEAKGSGGGLYMSNCDKSAERSGRCTLLDTQADRLSAMQVVFRENHAGLAGGGIFINCPEISTTCNAVIDSLIHLPKIQAHIVVAEGNTADGYGGDIAQAPSRLLTSNVVLEYVPGREADVLRFEVALLDERGHYVTGSDTNVNPYQISLEVCPGDSTSTARRATGAACSSQDQLQPKQVFRLDPLKVWTDVEPMAFYIRQCLVGSSHVSVHLSLDESNFLDVSTLQESFLVRCMPCLSGETRSEIEDEFGRRVWKCQACQAQAYITDNNDAQVPCQPCPKGAVCDGKNLRGQVEGSEWLQHGSHMRLQSCPGVSSAAPLPRIQNRVHARRVRHSLLCVCVFAVHVSWNVCALTYLWMWHGSRLHPGA